MNEDTFEKNIQAARKLGLSPREKQELKEGVWRFMDAHPEPSPLPPVPSPYYFPRLYAGMMVSAVFVAYVGFAEAAQPGDAMYYFKTNVNEPFVKTLAFSPELRAGVSRVQLERRLKEAAQLALDSEATSEEWESLHDAFDKTSADAKLSVDEVSEKSGAVKTVRAARDQNAALDAHARILEELATSSEDAEEVSKVLEEVREYRVYTDDVVEEAAGALSEDADIEGKARESLRLSEEVLSKAVDMFAESGEGNTTTEALKSTVKESTQNIEDGRKALEDESYEEAFLLFEEARESLSELFVIEHAREALELRKMEPETPQEN